jgi:hypothetical protein
MGSGTPAADRLARGSALTRSTRGTEPDGGIGRLAHMQTLRHPGRGATRSLGLVLAVLIAPALAACSSAAGPPAASATPSAVAPSTAPSAAPSQAPSSDPGASVGSGEPAASDQPVIDPAGRLVKPKPGQLEVHPISATSFTAAMDGRRVVITVAYTSGVEPCSVLDSIKVLRGTGTFAITLLEGRGPEEVMCMMIAEFKRATVDLGELAPGTYTISDATGGAAPITVTVT